MHDGRRLQEESPFDVSRRFPARERATELGLAAAFLLVSGALAAASAGPPRAALAAGLVLAYAAAARVPFHVGAGVAVPTQLLFVPMLFLLPPGAVPLLVAAALVLSSLPDLRHGAVERLLSAIVDGWYAVGPAVVLTATGNALEPAVLAAAFAAQVAGDALVSTVREWAGRGIRPGVQLWVLTRIWGCDALLTPIGALAVAAAHDRPAAAFAVLPLVALLGLLARDRAQGVARAAELARAHTIASRAALTDALTGLGNQRRFRELLEQPGPAALIILDVDDFKQVNDRHGHQTGDAVLRAIGEVVRASCRAGDEAARYGGEEIAVLLPGATLDRAHEVAERIRAAIEAHPHPLPDGSMLAVTASIGVAAGSDRGELLAAADAALYEAKREGKNAVRPWPLAA